MNEDYLQQKRLNRKLKTKIWDDYRKYKDELRILKQQNRSLEESIRIEKSKNREIFDYFSTRIAQLQSQIASFQNNPTPITSTNTKKKNKPNLEWKCQELEEEGKTLQFDTEMIFQKCRQTTSLKFWTNDFPAVTNYDFEYTPIVISQPTMPIHNRYDSSIVNSSVSTDDSDDNIVSPIKQSRKEVFTQNTIPANDNISDTISTIRNEPHLRDKYEFDNNHFISENNSLNANPSKPQTISKPNNYKVENTKSSNEDISVHKDSTLGDNRETITTTKHNSQLPSPISIQTNLTADSNIFNKQKQMKPPSPKQDVGFYGIDNKGTTKTNDEAEFLSQSGWDNLDDEKVYLDLDRDVNQDHIGAENVNDTVNSNEKENVTSIPSMTNPILDSSTQIQETGKIKPIPIEDNNQVDFPDINSDSFDIHVELND